MKSYDNGRTHQLRLTLIQGLTKYKRKLLDKKRDKFYNYEVL